MRTLRYLSGCLLICLLALNSYAGTKLPLNTSGEVVYRQSFKLHSNFTDEDAYAIIQDWFSTGAGKFTCQNADGSSCSCKNKTMIEEEFDNSRPLQSLDPASGRMSGKGLIKYFGDASSAIGVLYMEYYIVLEVKDHQLTATISKMKYHHFNQRTYASKPIYGWQGGKPYDSADRLENLVNGQSEGRDIQDLGAFINKNVVALFNNLQSFLQNKAMVNNVAQPSAFVKEN